MKYKVLFDNGINFDCAEDANVFAMKIFVRIGIIPEIVVIPA